MPELPYEAYAMACGSLPNMGPARLLAAHRFAPLDQLWSGLRGGDPALREPLIAIARGAGRFTQPSLDEIVDKWYVAARRVDPGAMWQALVDTGMRVAVIGTESYPDALASDIEPPPVLYYDGDLDALAGTRVAIVGTRACSRLGRELASEWGERLSDAGVAIVSGLAAGIDAAAHAGAARGHSPPIAVVGSGLDVVYPKANAALWQTVRERGVILSEAPLGALPDAWRFPARNRIIAALADVVVVVESHEHGGSLITARDAVARGRTVMAVPGTVRSSASVGTNQLLRDGALVALSVDDVLAALGLTGASARRAEEHRRDPSPDAAAVLDALGWLPATIDQLASRSALDLGALSLALDELVDSRWVAERAGWYERVSRDRAPGPRPD